MGICFHDYQTEAVDWVLETFQDEMGAGLFADPGLGKTLMSLEVIRRGGFKRVLVIAPLRCVYSVWPQEFEKWGIVEGDLNIAHGPRKAITDARVNVINRDAMKWLEEQDARFDLIIIDEITSFKNWTTQRMKCLRRILKRNEDAKRLGLTGTPCPNTFIDLFSQVYALDGGSRLGRTITNFRKDFCKLGGFRGREWIFDPDRRKLLECTISDITLRLDALDHLELPSIMYNDVWVSLPAGAQKVYNDLERDLFAKLSDDEALLVGSASSAYGVCRQASNGRVYREAGGLDRESILIHKEKLAAVSELLSELNGKPAIIAYSFKHDLEALRSLPELKKARAINGDTSAQEAAEVIRLWNDRAIDYVLVHPAAVSHGVNMQAGGNDLIWFGITDRLEDYLQLNRRLYRQGVEGSVRIHHVMAKDTVEVAMIQRLRSKDEDQGSLLDSLRRYRDERS